MTTLARARMTSHPALASVPDCILALEADGVLYQDSARTTLAVADADPVGSWTDASSSANHALQATSSKRPLLKLNIVNGKPVLRFDGVDDVFALTSAITSADLTLFAVSIQTANRCIALGKLTTQGGFFGTSDSPNLHLFRDNADTGLTLTVNTIASWHQYTSRVASTAAETWQDGVSKGTGTVGAHTFEQVGARVAQVSTGDIAAIFAYNRALTTAERQRVESYLRSKYGTP